GDRLAGTPEHHGSFYANYYRMLPGGMRLDIDYGLTFTGNVLTRVGQRNGGEVLGGYTLHNISVGIGKDRWTATLYADNLLDKFAETGVRETPEAIRDVAGFSSRRYFRDVLRPRTFGVALRYSLGDGGRSGEGSRPRAAGGGALPEPRRRRRRPPSMRGDAEA